MANIVWKKCFLFQIEVLLKQLSKKKKKLNRPDQLTILLQKLPWFLNYFSTEIWTYETRPAKRVIESIRKGRGQRNVKIIVKFNHPWRIVVCTKVGKWNEWHLFWSFSFTEICKCLLNNKMNHNYWHSFANKNKKNSRKYFQGTR